MPVSEALKTKRKALRKPKRIEVGVINKMLRILEAIQASPLPLHLTDICKVTGINKSTAYRILTHLQREGYLYRGESGNYSFGMKLVQLGTLSHRGARLQEVARPVLRELWEKTQETVNLAVLDDSMVLYVEVLESPHIFRLASSVGMRRPIHSTALGKALGAFLPDEEREKLLSNETFEPITSQTVSDRNGLREELSRVRRRGYAIDDEESVEGARCVGVPILNHNQESLAAISVSGPTSRMSRDKIPSIATAVQEAARTISAQLGFD